MSCLDKMQTLYLHFRAILLPLPPHPMTWFLLVMSMSKYVFHICRSHVAIRKILFLHGRISRAEIHLI